MYPRPTRLERLLKKRPPFYGEIENTIYAMKVNPPSDDQFSEINRFTFFVIFTRVGVGDDAKNIIKNVHVRFRFEKALQSVPDMEVVSIRPTGESR